MDCLDACRATSNIHGRCGRQEGKSSATIAKSMPRRRHERIGEEGGRGWDGAGQQKERGSTGRGRLDGRGSIDATRQSLPLSRAV